MALYGRGWERFVDRHLVRGHFVTNDSLACHYPAAGGVLNDRWDHMREAGLLSDRLFVAAASRARVVSDDVECFEKLFAGLVRTFRTPEELLDLVGGAQGALSDYASRAVLARNVGREHSFDARATTMLAAAVKACRRPRRALDAVAEGAQ